MAHEYGEVRPLDEHNRKRKEDLHPSGYTNPAPAQRYNLLVVGAGPAGLVCAAGAAGLGAKVALVERHLMGGDCLNVGCVPSKCLLRSARALHKARHIGEHGGRFSGELTVDFGLVMERMRRLRTSICEHDSVKRFTDLGVDVFLGEGAFTSEDAFEIGDRTIRFARAAITTGTRAAMPPIDGLAEARPLTNATLFDLTERPRRMAIIGGGPIGCEMAQAFARFGTEVHLFHRGDHLLEKEDADAAAVVQAAMARDGVGLHLSTSPRRISVDGPDKTVHWQADGASRSRPVDEILVSAGRTPNVEDLGLDAAGVEYDARRGVAVDDRLRTSNPKIYAAGDVCMKYKFTHAADAAARILLRNALFRGRSKLSDLVVPWVTYTSPEIGHVGLYPQEARDRGIGTTTFRRDLAEVDRAVCDGETEGFVKVHVREGTDRILGATVVAEHAGGMMGELSAAITLKQGLGSLAGVIHPYPTQAEAIRQAGDAYNRTRLTPLVAGLMRRWLRWTR